MGILPTNTLLVTYIIKYSPVCDLTIITIAKKHLFIFSWNTKQYKVYGMIFKIEKYLPSNNKN